MKEKQNLGNFAGTHGLKSDVCRFVFYACSFPDIEEFDRTHRPMVNSRSDVLQISLCKAACHPQGKHRVMLMQRGCISVTQHFFLFFLAVLSLAWPYSSFGLSLSTSKLFCDVLVCGKLVHVFWASFCCLGMTNRLKE